MISPRLQQGFLFYLLISALLLAWAMQPLAHAKAIVDLQPESVVAKKEVHLSDIALIQGAPANQKELLGSIFIGHAPGHARSTEIRRSYIIAKMKQNFIDMDAVVVKGPEKVKVRSDGKILKGEKLVELTQKYILENTGWNKEDVRFEWSRIPRDQSLPPGTMKVDIWKVSGGFLWNDSFSISNFYCRECGDFSSHGSQYRSDMWMLWSLKGIWKRDLSCQKRIFKFANKISAGSRLVFEKAIADPIIPCPENG